MYWRQITARDGEAVFRFLDTRTIVLRWLAAFFRNLDRLPEEEEPSWSLWWGSVRGDAGPSCIAAHFFTSATTYLCSEGVTELRAVEDLLDEELLPERVVGDAAPLKEWMKTSPEFFERLSGSRGIHVLVSGPKAPDVSVGSGFRAAAQADLPVLEEYGRLYAAEAEEDALLDFESLIAHGLVCVCEGEGKVKGFVRSNFSDGRYVHGGGLYVHPLYRGKGVGRALALGLAARVHAEAGVPVILDVYGDNTPAIRAYEAAGYTKAAEGLELVFVKDCWRE